MRGVGDSVRAAVRLPSLEWAAISIVVSLVAVFAVAVFVIGLDALSANLAKFTPDLILLCALLLAWQLGCRFLRWFLFARSLGVPVGVREAMLYYAAAFGMTLTPGRLGETLRLWFLERRFGMPYRRLAGLYVADRLADATAYLVMFAAGATASRQHYPVAWFSMLAPILLALAAVTPRPGILVLNALYAAIRRGRKPFAWLRRAVRNMS